MVSIPAELYGETKNILCLCCGAEQRIVYQRDQDCNVKGLIVKCRECRKWFQVNIEQGEQRPVDCTTKEKF